MPDPLPIAALILAAGFSSRMETGYKLLLPLHQGHALDCLARLYGEFPVTAVSGQREGEAVAREAARLGWARVHNPQAGRGMFSSVCAGLEAMALTGAEHCFLHPADIPLVRPCTLHLMLEEARRFPDTVLIPTFKGQEGHPPLLPCARISAILAWTGEGGLRGALAHLPIRRVPVPDSNILLDMDTEADYAEARLRAGRQHLLEPPEAEELLRCRALAPNIAAHVRVVARVAVAFAKALGLDPLLTESGALLHDMCREESAHGRAAARELRALSLPRLAELVEEHTDCSLPDSAPFSEKEIIYLADKYVSEDQVSTLRERFAPKMELYANKPKALAAARARLARAEAMEQRLARELKEAPLELARRAVQVFSAFTALRGRRRLSGCAGL